MSDTKKPRPKSTSNNSNHKASHSSNNGKDIFLDNSVVISDNTTDVGMVSTRKHTAHPNESRILTDLPRRIVFFDPN